MSGWGSFWLVFAGAALVGYAGLAVVVAVRSIDDLRWIFQRMKETQDPDE